MISVMNQHNGLLAPVVAAAPVEPEAIRERERLRRELLQRIIDREARRQASRGTSR